MKLKIITTFILLSILFIPLITVAEDCSGQIQWAGTISDTGSTGVGETAGSSVINLFQFTGNIEEYQDVVWLELNNVNTSFFRTAGAPDSASTTCIIYEGGDDSGQYIGSGTVGYWESGGKVYFYVEPTSWDITGLTGSTWIYVNYTIADLYNVGIKQRVRAEDGNLGDAPILCRQNWGGYNYRGGGNYAIYTNVNWLNTYEITEETTSYHFNLTKNISGTPHNSKIRVVAGVDEYINESTFNHDPVELIIMPKTKTPIYIYGEDPYGHTYEAQCYEASGVSVWGIAFNATNGALLSDVNITYNNASLWYNATTDANGEYTLYNLPINKYLSVNATKPGYTFNDFDVLFYEAGTYTINIPMIPNAGDYSQACAAGVVVGKPYSEPVEGATVYLWNASYSTSTTTSSTGWYYIEGLSADTYTINATHSSYDSSSDESITLTADEYEIHNFLINPNLDLTVTVKDAETFGLIVNGTVVVGSTSQSTPVGVATFTNLDPGSYEVSAQAEGYYPGVIDKVVDDFGETTTIYLTSTAGVEESGAGAQYPPHKVEFRVIDIWGLPLTDITVTASGTETTVANQTWWEKWLGINPSVDVYNETMTGTTDSAGHISFLMVETVKYQMTFVNASQNISATHEIYPKDDRYTITIGEIPSQKLAYWVTSEQNNTDNTGNLTLHYIDYNDPVKTNWVNFSVYFLDNDTLAYTHNFTSINDTNENTTTNLNASYIYKIRCVADHDDFGIFTWFVTVGFIMPDMPKLPVVQDLTDELDDWQVTIIGMFILIVFAFIFGAVSSGIGGMVIAFMSSAFYYFGLLPLISSTAAHVIFPLIIVIAILNLMITQKEAR